MNDDYVIRANIERFSRLLEETRNADERATIARLLAEERRKLASRDPPRR